MQRDLDYLQDMLRAARLIAHFVEHDYGGYPGPHRAA